MSNRISTVIKAVTDLPARLFGGNAQKVEVSGLDYTLHLDLEKLPPAEAGEAPGKWTVVWDESTDTYRRVEFTDLPPPLGYNSEVIDDRVAQLLKGGNNIAVVYDDPGNRITIHGLAISGTPGPQNVFDTIHDAQLASIPASVKNVMLMGYDRSGDAGPAMPSRRTVAMVTTHNGVWRSADRYTDAGVEDAVNGGWWEYIGNNQPLWIEWFGGKADYKVPNPANLKGDWLTNPTPTDNYQPIMDAIQFVYGYIKHANTIQPEYPLWASGTKIQLGIGQYYCSQTIVPDRTITIEGMGGYGSAPLSWLRFPDNVTAFRFESNYGEKSPSSAMSALRDFAIRAVTDAGSTDITKHGIIFHTPLELSHLNIECFGGHGIHIETNAEFGHTNANCFYLNHIFINYCGGHGVYTKDADSNAGVGFALNITACGRLLDAGYGIYDGAFLANCWVACHASGNGRWDGVLYGGAYYAEGINAPSTFLGCYSEGDQGPSYCGPYAKFEGGLHGAGVTVASAGSFVSGNRHIGGIQSISSEVDDSIGVKLHVTANTVYTFYRRVGGADGLPFEFYWFPTGGIFGLRYAGGNWSYGVTDDTGVWNGARPGPQPVPPNQFVLPQGVFLGGGVVYGRKFDVGEAAPTEGMFALGERRFLASPTPGGIEGWVCTQAGFMGQVWAAGWIYVPPMYAKNAGNWYRMSNQYGATSANPPVHTSGTVTGADGMAWEYLGNTDAVWKTFGLVGALERVDELEARLAQLEATLEARHGN